VTRADNLLSAMTEPAPDASPPDAVPVTPSPTTADSGKSAKAGKDPKPAKPGKVFRRRHSWPQRLILVLNIGVVGACFATATALVLGHRVGDGIAKVTLSTSPPSSTVPGATGGGVLPGTTVPGESTVAGSQAPTETFPAADPAAQNFLITGADNDACIDPSSPYAGAFGDRSSLGERSDTIMVMRVDPPTHRAALLSFPRDLWVTIHGRGGKNRINSAYVKNQPDTLIQTLKDNFGISIDHFLQIDFCAFKTIIDSIDGGVGVPFEYPARDRNTGLNVPTKGCYYFSGDAALAYVRSRHYEYQLPSGKWKAEGLSDLARISRQQDFIRRVLQTGLNKGLFNPSILRGLINVATKNVVVDTNLTLSRMLEFAGVLRDVQAAGIASYQIDAVGQTINGNAVLQPITNSDNMKAILKVFRGQAQLAEAPVQVLDSTTTLPPDATDATDATDTGASSSVAATTAKPLPTLPTTTVAPGKTTTTVAADTPDENNKGIVPPRDVVCNGS
jgi:LCP family protein required for cell wall assembly